jgi:hypothetical protein
MSYMFSLLQAGAWCRSRSNRVSFGSLFPALIAEYQTQLPDKKLVQSKLHEFYLQNTAL